MLSAKHCHRVNHASFEGHGSPEAVRLLRPAHHCQAGQYTIALPVDSFLTGVAISMHTAYRLKPKMN